MNRIDRLETGLVVLVDDAGKLIGTATDGDIRRGVLSGLDLEAPVSEVMNEDPLRIRASWEHSDIQEYLETVGADERIPDHRIIITPVVDQDDRVLDIAYLSHDGEVRRREIEGVEQDQTAANQPPAELTAGVESVLIIGGAGYIGSVLVRKLIDEGYFVRVLDNLIYGGESLEDLSGHDRFELIEADMRSIEAIMESIKGVDAVVHLGALVGDPASGIDAQKTLEINYHAVRLAASICKHHQVNRFIFASTCSVYGRSHSPTTLLTEDATTNPVSLYGKTKLNSELALLEMADDNFSPTIFRMATIYGLSPRMRFDLVVNILSAKSYEEGVIPIFGGDQYRPLVHVADAAQAYLDCLNTPISTVNGEIYNIGSNGQNYPIIDVGREVQAAFPNADIDRRPEQEDERTYQVDFSKAHEQLGFETNWTIEESARKIKQAFEDGRFQNYTADKYSNYRTLQNADEIFTSEDGLTPINHIETTSDGD